MIAKAQLRERVEAFSEQEASEALRLWGLRAHPVIVAFRDAPRQHLLGPSATVRSGGIPELFREQRRR